MINQPSKMHWYYKTIKIIKIHTLRGIFSILSWRRVLTAMFTFLNIVNYYNPKSCPQYSKLLQPNDIDQKVSNICKFFSNVKNLIFHGQLTFHKKIYTKNQVKRKLWRGWGWCNPSKIIPANAISPTYTTNNSLVNAGLAGTSSVTLLKWIWWKNSSRIRRKSRRYHGKRVNYSIYLDIKLKKLP